MLTLANGRKIMPTLRSRDRRKYSELALRRLSTDVFFWNLFQVHWLHALHFNRLGPDLGGFAVEGYPPCPLQEAASNLMRYAKYRFLVVETRKRKRFPLTEGLLDFLDCPLRILPGGRPGLWAGTDFSDFKMLETTHSLRPSEVYSLFISTIEGQ